MWKRFVRALKAIFGGMVGAIEDPKLILEQNIRELNDQVPKMNENIATVKASVMMLEKEFTKSKREYEELVSKMKAAINQGRDDIASNYALRLEQVKSTMLQVKEQHETAQRAYEKALEVKKVFMLQRERKISEAREALAAHERAKWQAKIADTLEQFEVAGIDATHDEMVRKVNEQTAKNEARMEMALESVDTSSIKVEEEAQKLRANDLVRQFKEEMGMFNSESPAKTEDVNLNSNKTLE